MAAMGQPAVLQQLHLRAGGTTECGSGKTRAMLGKASPATRHGKHLGHLPCDDPLPCHTRVKILIIQLPTTHRANLGEYFLLAVGHVLFQPLLE